MPKNLWNLHDSPEVLGTHSKATLSDEGSINKKHVEPLQQWLMAMQLFQEYSKLTRNIAFFRTNFCSPSTHHRWGETVWHGEKWRCQSIPCWRVRRSLVPFATWKNTRWVPIGLQLHLYYRGYNPSYHLDGCFTSIYIEPVMAHFAPFFGVDKKMVVYLRLQLVTTKMRSACFENLVDLEKRSYWYVS